MGLSVGALGALAWAHEIPELLATAVAASWCAVEYLARRSTWLQGAPRRPSGRIDRGTYPLIAFGVIAGLAADLLGFISGVGGYLPGWAALLGALIAAVGLAIRRWALRTLGRFFTMPITLAADHRIVRTGPYRWIRHPSYTGGFLTALGLAVTLGAVAGVLITFVACALVYVYRIRVEEGVLVSRFGEEYREYARHTFRLLPGIY